MGLTRITKDMIIAQILEIDEGLGEFLMNMGMHCLHCPSAIGESLEDACAVHGADCDAMVEKMNEYLKNK